MSTKKPTPKSQREISLTQQSPYVPPSGSIGFSETGNPNDVALAGRAGEISFKDDTTKPFSIGIKDIDEAIFYYFQNIIKPYVIQDGSRIEVPVIYGSPEKWASFQKNGFYRDAQGRLMMPLMMVKRDSIDKVRNVANKLDANNPHNLSVWQKKYSSRNSYNNFDVLNNVVPEKTAYAVVVPDYISLKYSCAINTYYVEQLNKIVEAIEYASDSYWGNPQRFQFRAMIDSFSIKTQLTDKEERVVSSTFDLKIWGYIIPDIPQKDLTSVKKLPGINSVIINEKIS